MRLSKFFGRMFSEWGSALSGPASVPFAVLALFGSGTAQRLAYGALAVILAFVSAYRIWAREYERAETADKKYNDERPRVIFAVRSPKTLEAWRSLENVSPPPIFRLEHSGGRVARFVKIEPIQSALGRFRLEFDEAPILNSGYRQQHPLTFTVHQNDALSDLSYDPKILAIQQGVNMLLDFFRNHSPETKEDTYKVTVLYRDERDDSAEYAEEFTLKCNYQRMLLSVEPKPRRSD